LPRARCLRRRGLWAFGQPVDGRSKTGRANKLLASLSNAMALSTESFGEGYPATLDAALKA
jgi:hypothetical protein